MDDRRIKDAFSEIHADEDLKRSTLERIYHKKRKPRGRWIAAASVAALFALTLGLSQFFVFSAAAYIGIDVNPSVELTLNRLHRVIEARALNTSGEKLLAATDIRWKDAETATGILVSAAETEGFVRDQALFSVTVLSKEDEALCRSLEESVQGHLYGSHHQVEVYAVSEDVREKANACHMSPAKYLAAQELMAVDEGAQMDDLREESIQQIRRRTRECHAEKAQSGGKHHRHRGDRN